MLRSKSFKCIYRIIYCVIAFVGVLASLGVFESSFNSFFYIYFTNISNYYCLFIVLGSLFCHNNGKNTFYILKFTGLIAILLTFIVFNFVLVPSGTMNLNYGVKSAMFHHILPVMYLIDWLLFTEKGIVKWYYPLLFLIYSFCYVFLIYLRAGIYKFDLDTTLLYPYYFFDIGAFGLFGVFKYLVLLVVFILLIGYIFYIVDIYLFKKMLLKK